MKIRSPIVHELPDNHNTASLNNHTVNDFAPSPLLLSSVEIASRPPVYATVKSVMPSTVMGSSIPSKHDSTASIMIERVKKSVMQTLADFTGMNLTEKLKASSSFLHKQDAAFSFSVKFIPVKSAKVCIPLHSTRAVMIHAVQPCYGRINESITVFSIIDLFVT